MKLATQISLGFFIAISIDLVDSYVNYSLTTKVTRNSNFLTNSEVIIRTSADLKGEILGMQNAERGFLLSGDASFLSRYKAGLTSIPALLTQQRLLVGSSAGQAALLDSISRIHQLWVFDADRLIAAKQTAIRTPLSSNRYDHLLQAQFAQNAGRRYNDRIAAILRSFDQHEYDIRQKRRDALNASILETDRFSLFFSLLLVVIGAALSFYLVRRISRRIRSMVKLAQEISRGNFTTVNDDRKDELTGLAVSLNSMSRTIHDHISTLQKKNDELDQFAYVVSHDLKAPIRGISNVVQWIDEDLAEELSPEMRTYYDIIGERTKRMGDLIDGLLDYARIGRKKVTPEQVDVNAMVSALAALLLPKGCTVTIGSLPTFMTEKISLERVFTNLLSNAAKYIPPNNGRVDVGCKHENSNFYRFSVRDNGIGIDEQYHEKIFGMFQTLREKDDKESTGIGLAIVKKIVEENGGTVMISSTSGRGAKFSFTWPKH